MSQRDEVLLLALVKSMPSEFDQYVSQVLSFVPLFCLGQKKTKASVSKKYMERAERQIEGLVWGQGLTEGCNFTSITDKGIRLFEIYCTDIFFFLLWLHI